LARLPQNRPPRHFHLPQSATTHRQLSTVISRRFESLPRQRVRPALVFTSITGKSSKIGD
jgi:hypothetical protein